MLTSTQKKILKLLAINCRYTNKDIGKAVRKSEDAVKYQIDKMIHKDKLSTFTASFHFKELGFDHHHYLIRVKDLDKLNLFELAQIQEIFFINTSSGDYDIQMILCHRDDEELMRIKQKIDGLFKDNIVDSVMLKFYVQYKFTNIVPIYDVAVSLPKNQKNSIYKLNEEDWHSNNPIKQPLIKLGTGERKTIKKLLQNPRASYTEIGKTTKQSYETVRQQIQKFSEKGFIGSFGAFPDYAKYGYFGNFFLMNIRELDDKKLLDYVATKKNIFYAAKLIGKYNVIVYFVSEKPSELHREAYELRQLFKDQVIDITMLSFEKVVKSVQFPQVLL